MTLALFAHPFSSYCQKALIALWEKDIAFDYRMLGPEHPENFAGLKERWPFGQFPLLTDGDAQWAEATIIIEHLDIAFGEPPRMLPADPAAALPIRLLDRVFDNQVMNPLQRIVGDFIRDPADRDPTGVARDHARLDIAFDWLEQQLGDDGWIAGDFSLADCAAGPALFYADWVHPIGPARPRLAGYRARLNARPSIARAIEEARPFRSLFPPGAPDRD